MIPRSRLLKITGDLLANPVAPFREEGVRNHIKAFCVERDIDVVEDEMGNLVATYGRRYRNRPFVFAAHMDHPGFIVEKDSVRGRTVALFYGSVEKSYFKKDTKVRVFTAAGPVRARVSSARTDKKRRVLRIGLAVDGPVSSGDMAMWDLPAFRVSGDRLTSRACDDCVGCASVLALFDQLVRRKVRQKVMALFTVAEEGGFHGAKYFCSHTELPNPAALIAIETSQALPAAPMGGGVVIRVGDAITIFNPAVTAFMAATAAQLRTRCRAFKFQRKLMDGGTCESTIYEAHGYTSGAVCIPLGNYHNRDDKHGRIAAEYVSVSDLRNMVALFEEMVDEGKHLSHFLKPDIPSYVIENRSLGERFITVKGGGLLRFAARDRVSRASGSVLPRTKS
jgi:putative aminopeptidase FrvX